MNNDFLTFRIEDLQKAVDALESIGYSLQNPVRNEISGFDNNSGDRVLFESKAEALAELVKGASGIQLWKKGGEDYFLNIMGPSMSISLDAHSALERQQLYTALQNKGVEYFEDLGN